MSSRRNSRSGVSGVPSVPPALPALPESSRSGFIANLPKTPKTPKRRNSTPLQVTGSRLINDPIPETGSRLDLDVHLDRPPVSSSVPESSDCGCGSSAPDVPVTSNRRDDPVIEPSRVVDRPANSTERFSSILSNSGRSSTLLHSDERASGSTLPRLEENPRSNVRRTPSRSSESAAPASSAASAPSNTRSLNESLEFDDDEGGGCDKESDESGPSNRAESETPSQQPEILTRSKPPTPRRIPQMPNLPTVRQALANLPSTRSKNRSSNRGANSSASRPLTDLVQSSTAPATPSTTSTTPVSAHDGLAIPVIPMAPDSDSVDLVLSKLGYHVLSKVLVKDADRDPVHARFLDVLNNLGQRVFVELDIEGHLAAQSQDPIMIQGSSRSNSIPHSCKVGTFECAGQEVAGVAFAYSDDAGRHHDICSLLRDEDGSGPLEVNYHLDQDTAEIMTKPVAYPIVRLSEIVDNPDSTLRNINEATRRIRNTTYENCKTELEQTREAIRKLGESFIEFNEVQSRCSHELMASIRSLEKIHQQYREFPPTTDENRERYRKLLFNFRKRHEFAIELIGVCQLVNAQRETILQYTQLIREALDYCRKEFRDINRIIDE